MTGGEPRPRATVREVPRSGTWDNARHGSPPKRTAPSSKLRDSGAIDASPHGLRVAWRIDATFRLIAAVAVVIFGCGLVFGLTLGEFAIVVGAVTVVVVATVLRAALSVGAALDGPGQRAFADAVQVASSAVFVALVGAATVIVLVFGARLIAAIR